MIGTFVFLSTHAVLCHIHSLTRLRDPKFTENTHIDAHWGRAVVLELYFSHMFSSSIF